MTTPMYRQVGNDLVCKCEQCGSDHRLSDSHHVTITTPTGDYGARKVWGHPGAGRVHGAREEKTVRFPVAVRVTRRLCAGCWWKVDMAARRGVCVVRSIND
jgi:hypothetical protein